MLPLFRERGRHARIPLGPPPPSTYHCHPLAPVLSPRDLRPLVANPLSAPRNVNSRRFNSYEYFPRAWDDRGVAEKTWARMKKKRRKKTKKRKEEIGGRTER